MGSDEWLHLVHTAGEACRGDRGTERAGQAWTPRRMGVGELRIGVADQAQTERDGDAGWLVDRRRELGRVEQPLAKILDRRRPAGGQQFGAPSRRTCRPWRAPRPVRGDRARPPSTAARRLGCR